MTRLSWGNLGERRFEAGVDRGVLYVDEAVPWNGLVSVNQGSEGGTVTPYYMDGVKYRRVTEKEEFVATLEAFTYPDEFAECDGTGYLEEIFEVTEQKRRPFGLSYRTRIGNDTEGIAHGYKIHLVYNALATPSQKAFNTLNESLEPSNFSWDMTTIPIPMPGLGPSGHIAINSTKLDPYIMSLIENELYGSALIDGHLITPTQLIDIYKSAIDEVEIDPDAISGLALLIDDPVSPDLRGLANTGVFVAPDGTRLEETTTPGLYILE